MKHLKLFFIAFLGCIMLNACGGGDEDDNGNTPSPGPSPVTGKEYTATYNIPAEGCSATYTLKDFSSAISAVSSTPDWLTISIRPYSSGQPTVSIVAKANTGTAEHKYPVVITSKNGDKLTLTIVQAAKPVVPSGIDDVHDNVSTKPAYSPQYKIQ